MHKLEITGSVTSARINRILAYWQEQCRARLMPAKRDIDPAALKPLLPYLMIAEIHREPVRVRYRLVGTEAARFARGDYTGHWLHDSGWAGDEIASYVQQYSILIETRLPLLGTGHLIWDDGKEAVFEWGKFPLSEDGDTVTHCLGIEDVIPVRPVEALREPARR